MATEDHGSKETLDEVSDIPLQRKFIPSQGRMMMRQWTTDGYLPTSLIEVSAYTPKRPCHSGAAFLLRPVSKTTSSFLGSGQKPSKDFMSLIPLDRPPSPGKLAAIAAAVEAAGGPKTRPPKYHTHQSRAAIFAMRTHSAGEVNQDQG